MDWYSSTPSTLLRFTEKKEELTLNEKPSRFLLQFILNTVCASVCPPLGLTTRHPSLPPCLPPAHPRARPPPLKISPAMPSSICTTSPADNEDDRKREIMLNLIYTQTITFLTFFFDDIADLSFGLIFTLQPLLVILILIFLNPEDSNAETWHNVGLTQHMAL